MDAQKTGALIAQARKEKDLTQGQLAQRLQYAIDHPEQLAGMQSACRTLYEKYYSPRAFEETLTTYVQEFDKAPEE